MIHDINMDFIIDELINQLDENIKCIRETLKKLDEEYNENKDAYKNLDNTFDIIYEDIKKFLIRELIYYEKYVLGYNNLGHTCRLLEYLCELLEKGLIKLKYPEGLILVLVSLLHDIGKINALYLEEVSKDLGVNLIEIFNNITEQYSRDNLDKVEVNLDRIAYIETWNNKEYYSILGEKTIPDQLEEIKEKKGNKLAYESFLLLHPRISGKLIDECLFKRRWRRNNVDSLFVNTIIKICENHHYLIREIKFRKVRESVETLPPDILSRDVIRPLYKLMNPEINLDRYPILSDGVCIDFIKVVILFEFLDTLDDIFPRSLFRSELSRDLYTILEQYLKGIPFRIISGLIREGRELLYNTYRIRFRASENAIKLIISTDFGVYSLKDFENKLKEELEKRLQKIIEIIGRVFGIDNVDNTKIRQSAEKVTTKFIENLGEIGRVHLT